MRPSRKKAPTGRTQSSVPEEGPAPEPSDLKHAALFPLLLSQSKTRGDLLARISKPVSGRARVRPKCPDFE